MERVLAFFIGLVMLCDLAVVGLHVLDEHTSLVSGRPTVGGRPADTSVVPGAGQAFVTGTVDKVSAEPAQVQPVKTPFTITAVERGVGRLEIDKALVGGRRVTISWDGGTPLPVEGGGELVIGATRVVVDGNGPVYTLDGAARLLAPGTYSLGTTVGVGTGGIATPREGVVFTADDQTVLVSRGNVVIHLDPQKLDLLGPGKLTMAGRFKVQFPDRTANGASVAFGGGAYRVTVDPAGGGLAVDAILQGQVDIS